MVVRSQSLKGELERMRKEMDRIWNRFSQEFSASTFEHDFNPSLDLAETEESLVAEIELTGINPKDIDISVTSDMLTVTGEKKQRAKETGRNYHLVERAYGKFSRSIRLPTTVDPDQVEASYKDGILLIILGKTETIKSKKIEVKTT
jgi:HSP20 family protein